MYNQKNSISFQAYKDATKLAASGEEYSHLVALMEPEYALRLKLFVQDLPESVALKTIYGKCHWKEQSEAKQKKKRK
jgi:hypothetical protein